MDIYCTGAQGSQKTLEPRSNYLNILHRNGGISLQVYTVPQPRSPQSNKKCVNSRYSTSPSLVRIPNSCSGLTLLCLQPPLPLSYHRGIHANSTLWTLLSKILLSILIGGLRPECYNYKYNRMQWQNYSFYHPWQFETLGPHPPPPL
jgi:hypothetical protein